MEAITFGDDLPGFAIGNPTHPGVLLIQVLLYYYYRFLCPSHSFYTKTTCV